eukprot:795228-Prymnesium_polylepis.1
MTPQSSYTHRTFVQFAKPMYCATILRRADFSRAPLRPSACSPWPLRGYPSAAGCHRKSRDVRLTVL